MNQVKEFQEEWYLKRYGFTKESFTKFLKNKKRILEAGCGVGKDTELFGRNTKGMVYIVEITDAIETAKKNNRHLNNIVYAKTDITNLPFPDEFFDFVSCDQVIHHTPKPFETFKHLLKKTTKDGFLAVYFYKKKSVLREFSDDFIREEFTKLDFDECYELCKPITKLGKSLSNLNIKFKIPEDIPILGIKKGKYNLQRFFHYNVLKCFWNDNFSFHTNNSINVDWYNPEIAFRYTIDDIKKLCKDCKVKIIHIDEKEESGISVLIQK